MKQTNFQKPRGTAIQVACSSRALVSLSRRNELFQTFPSPISSSLENSTPQKARKGGTPLPSHGTSVLPGFVGRALILLIATLSSLRAEDLSFNRDIRPILSANCFACHGPDKHARKADRRLDTRDGALAENDKVRAIVPGDLDHSEAALRISSTDPDEVMPPPKSDKKLTPEQVALLKRWIAEGAKYEPHWSLIPPIKATVPTEKLALPERPLGPPDAASASLGTRNAYWPELKARRDTAVYRFEDMQPGHRIEGPSLVDAEFTTLVIPPGQLFHIDSRGLGILEYVNVGAPA